MKFGGIARPQAELTIKHMDANGKVMRKKRRGLLGWLGLTKPDIQVAHGKVTDAFVAFLVDAMVPNGGAQLALLDDFNYHQSGTSETAEDKAQTALITPVETTRDAGVQGEGATSNIYKSVATHTYGGSFDITEHGLFNEAGSGEPADGGTMLDRTMFGAVHVDATEKIEFTYQLTISSGG